MENIIEINGLNFTVPTDYNVTFENGTEMHFKLGSDRLKISVVKGDAKCASIAAASILAKARRDALMCKLASDYPLYAFDENKGYSSPHHIQAIKTYGLSDMHRRSFCASFLQESLFYRFSTTLRSVPD